MTTDPSSNPTILVLDDHKQVLMVMKTMLRKLNCEVITCQHAKDAVVQVLTHKPTVILSDIMMPEIDGFQFLKMIKSHDDIKGIPVIMVTAKNSRKDILAARQLGAANYVMKPITLEILKQKLGQELERLDIPLPWLTKKSATPEKTKANDTGAAKGTPSKTASGATHQPFTILNLPDPLIGLSKLLKRTKDLPALPVAVQRAIAVSSDESAGAADLAKIIVSDAAIAAMVLRTANSTFYGGVQKITDIKQAIIRIGFTTTRNLVVCFSVTSYFDSESLNQEFKRVDFWTHSLSTAILSGRLAKRAGMAEFSEAFIAGLLHDIGKIVMDEHIPQDFSKALLTAKASTRALHQVEFELFKFDHMDLGKALAERWQLPSRIVKAVAGHCKPSYIKNEPDLLSKQIMQVCYMANQLSKALGMGDGGDRLLGSIPDGMAKWAKLTGDFPKKLRDESFAELNEYREFLGAKEIKQVKKDSAGIMHYCNATQPAFDAVQIFLETIGYEINSKDCIADILNVANNNVKEGYFVITAEEELNEEDIQHLLDTVSTERYVLMLTPVRMHGRLMELINDDRLVLLPFPADREALRDHVSSLASLPFPPVKDVEEPQEIPEEA